jgi:hypothetical protein
MNLPIFSLRIGFALRAAKGLSHLRLLRNSPVGLRQDGLEHARHPNASAFGFPQLLKLLWLKPPFARIIARFISSKLLTFLREAWIDFERGVRGTRAGRDALLKFIRQSEGPQASEILPRRGKMSVPARNKPRQNP